MTTTTASNYAASASTTGAAQDALALIGRILIAALFIPAGFGKLTGFAGAAGYIASAGLPLPQLGAVIAIIVELGFGILLLVGFKSRLAAIVIAVFTVVAALFFHNYWRMPADKAYVNQLMFFKNLAIAGGLLAIAAFGPGRISVDRK
jgi:putative oxidoreductase